jgi:hypothetical protein
VRRQTPEAQTAGLLAVSCIAWLDLWALLRALPAFFVIGQQSGAVLCRRNRPFGSDRVPCPTIRIGATARGDIYRMLGQTLALADGVCTLLAANRISYCTRPKKFTRHRAEI